MRIHLNASIKTCKQTIEMCDGHLEVVSDDYRRQELVRQKRESRWALYILERLRDDYDRIFDDNKGS